jgi:hypothetical protein
MKIFSLEQQCFYGKFMSPATITRKLVFMSSAWRCIETKEYSNNINNQIDATIMVY